MFGPYRRPLTADQWICLASFGAAPAAHGAALELGRLVDAPPAHASWLAGKTWAWAAGLGFAGFAVAVGALLLPRPDDLAVRRLTHVASVLFFAYAAWQLAPPIAARFAGEPQERHALLVDVWWGKRSQESGRLKATIEYANARTVLPLHDEENRLYGLPAGTPVKLVGTGGSLGMYVRRIERVAGAR